MYNSNLSIYINHSQSQSLTVSFRVCQYQRNIKISQSN